MATPAPQRVADLESSQKKQLLSLMSADERSQTLGVVNLVLTVAVALRFPQFFWILHVVKALVLLPWRYVRFRKDNCELYLLDFCYMATYMTVLCCIVAYVRIATGYETFLYRYNTMFIHAGFTFANGSLAWSIIIFKNSLVFYNIDQLTSVFIHLSPAVFFWCLRWGSGFGLETMELWWPDMFLVCPGSDLQDADQCLRWPKLAQWCSACPASWHQFVVVPSVLYLIIWSIPYSVIVFCCCKGWIERRKKETLYQLVCNDPQKSRFIRLFPESMGPLAYMLQHFLVMLILGMFTIVFWHNFVLHTAFLAMLVLFAIHNGSTYTFRVFALRYADGVVKDNWQSFVDEEQRGLAAEGKQNQSATTSSGHQSYS